VLPTLADNSVDLIATDPPYFKVKGEAWDRQWESPQKFLEWLDGILAEFYRILKPNGSLYLFASPKMSARVECLIAERFNVLNNIVWSKENEPTHALKYGDDRFRQYIQKSERIIFAEHCGADGYAKGEAGYQKKCDELRGFVFEPLRAYLAGERDRAGVSNGAINAAWCKFRGVNSTSQTQKWFSCSCFNPPTLEAYQWLRETFTSLNHGGEYLKREYEDLRREYEDLRRPFTVTADVPYTDVWTFPTVQAYPGKHPCEKPLAMMEHIIKASSKPGAVVLDAFAGSFTTGKAAKNLGRKFVGIEKGSNWCEQTERSVAQEALVL